MDENIDGETIQIPYLFEFSLSSLFFVIARNIDQIDKGRMYPMARYFFSA